MERPDGLVSLTGRVDDIDEDLVLQLWLGETSVMIDSEGEPPLGIVGRFVDVVVEDLSLFPVDYYLPLSLTAPMRLTIRIGQTGIVGVSEGAFAAGVHADRRP